MKLTFVCDKKTDVGVYATLTNADRVRADEENTPRGNIRLRFLSREILDEFEEGKHFTIDVQPGEDFDARNARDFPEKRRTEMI